MGSFISKESSHSLQHKWEDYITKDLLSDYGHWTDVLHNAEANDIDRTLNVGMKGDENRFL